MKDFEEYKKMLVGKTLTNLFFTKQDGPYDYMPGITPAYYFSTILEIEGDKRFRFGNDFVTEWTNEEPLIELTNENWDLPKSLIFKGQKIVDLTKDEYEQLTFHLENYTTLAHTIDYGDQLFIENKNAENVREEVSHQQVSIYPKIKQAWWRRLFGK